MECFDLSHKKGFIKFVPNKYRTVNQDNSGFDTAFVKLEKQCSFAAMICFFIGMIISGCWYSLNKTTTTYKEFNPTPAKYWELSNTTDIVGKPTCPCETTLIEKGSFLSSVSFELDGVCSPINTTVTDPIHVRDMQKQYYTLYKPSSTGKQGSTNPGLTSVEPYFVCNGIDNTTEAAADCAVINNLALRVLEGLSDECSYVNIVHQREASLLMDERFYSVNAMDKNVLTSYLLSEFDSHALRAGMSELARVTGTILLAAETDWSVIYDISKHWGGSGTYSASCERITNGGKDATEFRLRNALQECLSSGEFSYRCCNKKGRQCNSSEALPCTPPMVELGHRFSSSKYPNMSVIAEFAYLGGMDKKSRANITSGGYYVNATGLAGAWDTYFTTCNPNECHYNTYGTPGAQAVLLILSGLVGGIWGVVTNGCLVGLVGLKKVALYRRDKKHDAVAPEPDRGHPVVPAGSDEQTVVERFRVDAPA